MKDFSEWFGNYMTGTVLLGLIVIVTLAVFQCPPRRKVEREVPPLEKADTTAVRASKIKVHGTGFSDAVYVLTVDGERYIVVRGNECVAVCPAK